VGAGNRSHIVTTAQYDDFDLTLECMIEKRGNSGIMYRVTEDADEPYHTGPEFQILGDPAYGNQNSNGKAGACYGLYAPRQQVAMPPDTWIKIRLLAAGSFVQHWVNGEKVVEYRIGSDDWNQRLAACQFRDKPKFGRNSTGYICLQAYTGTLRFRNIKIRRLTAHGEGPAVGAMPEKTISLDLGGGVTLPLTLVPAGKFVMGSPDSEQGRVPNEGLQHEVTISKPFYMGVTEVTQAQYEAVMGTNPSRFKGPTNPVERVSWDDAVLFCRELSEKTRKAFRLPTEAEWEYACRAGSKTRFSFGDSDSVFSYAWFGSNSGGKTNPVGCTKPNAWGLYDMHGNVSEWCADWYGSYSSGASTDPQGAGSGGDRVVRGGSWLDDDSVYFRCAVRYNLAPSFRSHDVGFRCAMTP
jgi:formylglycine-generating enzyme required for sulfatase activity